MNHIATGRTLSLGENYSHMVMVSTLDGEVDEDGASLDGGVDGDSGGEMEESSGGDSGGVPPSDLLRRQPSVSCFLVFCFSAASSLETPGDLFYRRF